MSDGCVGHRFEGSVSKVVQNVRQALSLFGKTNSFQFILVFLFIPGSRQRKNLLSVLIAARSCRPAYSEVEERRGPVSFSLFVPRKSVRNERYRKKTGGYRHILACSARPPPLSTPEAIVILCCGVAVVACKPLIPPTSHSSGGKRSPQLI